MDRDDIAGRIDSLITRANPPLTNQDVAEFVGGVTREAVRQWRLGRTLPRLEKLQPLAEVLKTTEEYLLFGYRSHAGDKKSSDVNLRERLVSNDDELQLLRYFRNTNPQGRKHALELARATQLANPLPANVHQIRKNGRK